VVVAGDGQDTGPQARVIKEMAKLESIELGSDHEPQWRSWPCGMDEQGFAAQWKAGNVDPGSQAAAACARQHRSSPVHGVLHLAPNTSIGARVRCMTLADISCEPRVRLVDAACAALWCCSLR
jgi:hypothetical protein